MKGIRHIGWAVALAIWVGGCAGRTTIPAWQQQIEEYISAEANDDPAALRDLPAAPGRRGFTLIGTADPRESTDAVGMLLGHPQIAGRRWFVFLVGLVEKQSVEEVRLAALSVEGGRFRWALGDADGSALALYRQFKERTWHSVYPNLDEPPADYLTFPGRDDSFQLTIAGNRLSVRHRQSGAQWTVLIP